METYTCSKCNGKGSTFYSVDNTWLKLRWGTCPKCKGYGNLDWIEMITGKKNYNFESDYFNPRFGTLSSGPR